MLNLDANYAVTKDTGEQKPAVKDRSVTDDPKNY